MHDTPKFLLIKRHDAKAAAASIRFYHGATADVSGVIRAIQAEDALENDGSVQSYLDLFTIKHLRIATVLGLLALQVVYANICD